LRDVIETRATRKVEEKPPDNTRYAIVEVGGRQIWAERGKFYDVNKIDVEVGSKINLNCVLLLNKDNDIKFGSPYMEDYKNITATVLKQFSGVKFLVYKMKPKKKMRRKQGFRNKLTRILIDNL
jgi:large subunit ribosomal protein L21